MTRTAVAVLLALLTGPAAAATSLPAIALQPAGDAWRVRYTLPAAAVALRFNRLDAAGHRAADWRALDPAFELVVDAGEEVVRRRDGAAFSTVAFEMPPRYQVLEKDYAPFAPFSDGGLLIHSGRFQACAERCGDSEDLAWSVTITPPAGAHVIQGGQLHDGPVQFVDRDNGTYLYVGHQAPVASADVLAVVDPEFPPAARRSLETQLPRLMALFAHELGALAQTPMLFASRQAEFPGGGYGYQGGTLPGQVSVHVYGQHALFAADDFAARMDWHFAHEAAHMYQRYEQFDAAPGASWIHEGGAEAMAAIALSRLGVLDADARRQHVDAALTECSAGLAERPLEQSADAGAFGNFYACGLLLQLAADAAARRADGCDLFCLWREFLAAVEHGADWSTATFAEIVEHHAGTGTADWLRRVAGERLDDPASQLRDGLRAAGVTFSATAAPSAG